ncbi:YncE family protein [Undibacterium arcticum]
MKKIAILLALTLGVSLVNPAWAAPSAQDRVYTADQNSNTVSVVNPTTNTLLGQIRLGNQRPDVLSPLYKGEINVHGLGFSPDHRTLIAISNGSNSVAFIDTANNKVKGITYIGRSPHEGFFTADGTEVWVVVRGEKLHFGHRSEHVSGNTPYRDHRRPRYGAVPAERQTGIRRIEL